MSQILFVRTFYLKLWFNQTLCHNTLTQLWGHTFQRPGLNGKKYFSHRSCEDTYDPSDWSLIEGAHIVDWVILHIINWPVTQSHGHGVLHHLGVGVWRRIWLGSTLPKRSQVIGVHFCLVIGWPTSETRCDRLAPAMSQCLCVHVHWSPKVTVGQKSPECVWASQAAVSWEGGQHSAWTRRVWREDQKPLCVCVRQPCARVGQ